MLKHELKDKIVAVASNLFKEKNYEDVSIRVHIYPEFPLVLFTVM